MVEVTKSQAKIVPRPGRINEYTAAYRILRAKNE